MTANDPAYDLMTCSAISSRPQHEHCNTLDRHDAMQPVPPVVADERTQAATHAAKPLLSCTSWSLGN